ncbi:MG2 domain-containing protein [Haliangium ochraceum]|uniref:A-macroglobulin complement component n=1 Tax=Haliangium ochraceum (strain DSM 14365 / JCM 11303 / SMP-2) TaxID=502025 RepID=D0LSH0_HALO1|nr:MG2 domain-containing protein [Haliangium ochraceum]ACY15669.1 A-macroglobulin complement component [Haliangium ochraceum DSM 14365]
MQRTSKRSLPLRSLALCLSLGALSCGARSAAVESGGEGGAGDPVQIVEPGTVPAPSALQNQLAAQDPARPQMPSDDQKRLGAAIDTYMQRHASQRLYMHVDKPLYRPGETIWFRVWELAAPTLTKQEQNHGVSVDLVSPRGSQVLSKRVLAQAGVAAFDFELPASVEGGVYILRARSDLGATLEREVVVSQYQPPRIKKKVEFLRKAYGAGDEVAAAVSLARATGEPLVTDKATAIVTVDEIEVARFPVQTSEDGEAVARFTLPPQIARGDGLLTLLVDDGGAVESMQKRIPILVKSLDLQLFPEGGQLVSGLPGRVYFQAKNPLGKPADIAGRVLDDRGQVVAQFSSLHNGMGRFELTPAKGRIYHVEVTSPRGIEAPFTVPPARPDGCSLMAVDDPEGQRDEVRVAAWCSSPRTAVVTGILREKRLADVAVEVGAEAPTVVAIPVPPGAQGAMRVTLFDEHLKPVAERLVYTGRGRDMQVSISTDRPSYAPRDRVALTVTTRDLRGKPVAADVSLAVVDDTVLSFADDKSAAILARVYLEAEMPGQEIEEPRFYFSEDPKAGPALDLVLGTQGWRRFVWQELFAEARGGGSRSSVVGGALAVPEADMAMDEEMEALDDAMPMPPPPPAPVAAQAAPGANEAMAAKPEAPAEPAPELERAEAPRRLAGGFGRGLRARRARPMEKKRMMAADEDEWGGEVRGWAVVREFPAPNYEPGYSGPRVDFRETIYWQPSVQTGADGTAEVSFSLSDAVTSFRATAEGVSGGGLPGRGEALVQSKLPVSLAVTMPLEVSAGDSLELPVVLTNETERPQSARITSEFGAAFRVRGGVPKQVRLEPGERQSFFAQLEVVGNGKDPEAGSARIAMDTANLSDEVARTIRVVPLGFPQELAASGTLDQRATHSFELAGAMPGSIEATITMYPSPLATMVQGTEALIREPGGCFEQASSSNYPNVMVLSYLEKNDAADVALVERTMGALDRGYALLTGYESKSKGYEWFGGDPGHEALTAYGLLEFVDMAQVYGDVDPQMVQRTRRWLMSRRDGEGGFLRNDRALDSFGRASVEVTNGYITYALTAAGEKALDKEIAYQQRMAKETKDPYLMALAAGTLVHVKAAEAQSAVTRLRSMQAEDGSFAGADHSITRSGGEALIIETTALAAKAMIDLGLAGDADTRAAIEWLNAHRGGYGQFSSTQATILALRALSAYAEASRATQSSGVATLLVNGKQAGTLRFEAGHKDALVWEDVARLLHSGKNTLELRLDSEQSLPYSIGISYRSKMPASNPETVVRVATSLSKDEVPVGEGVRMKVTVDNTTDEGQPMTLARVGIPGGLAFQTWQLEELKDKGVIGFFETREREVVLYFRDLAPKAHKEIDIDLLARVPGSYVAPASRAYLYYTDEFKHWVPPTEVRVTR